MTQWLYRNHGDIMLILNRNDEAISKIVELSPSDIHSTVLLAWHELQNRVESKTINESGLELQRKLESILDSCINKKPL
jgi:hypothetical protein